MVSLGQTVWYTLYGRHGIVKITVIIHALHAVYQDLTLFAMHIDSNIAARGVKHICNLFGYGVVYYALGARAIS